MQDHGNEMKVLLQKITQFADTDASLRRDLDAERSSAKVPDTASMTCIDGLIMSYIAMRRSNS